MDRQLSKIASLKKKSFSEAESVGLNVITKNGNTVQLVPVGLWILDPEFSSLWNSFSKWRHLNRNQFLARFVETPQNSKTYLSNFSIADTRRILFTIWVEGCCVGHIGLSNIDVDTAELDNVMKSTDSKMHFSMSAVINNLLTWAHGFLGVKNVSLVVLSSNTRAVDIYKNNGFETVEESYLKSISINGVENLIECLPNESNQKEKKLIMRKKYQPRSTVNKVRTYDV